ncbi:MULTISPECIES: exodeoxyribonuclease VII small subunit [Aliivibrio]|jgi:exodeoxyribonuclease VII small subunit|uniref:Exodeoxyribonuclease 7 small subunit n=3 Tax=Aliivibrio TaxID=511678 RepID=EX7S_ALISL|nr:MULTISPECIES: exodeoxyribonuclease VII small subunit [Aliivibrio]B6EIA9.1 RecName: Full=Exodeoxyribonuclease 7 small subunit; AltName: Full=Exodeoxyribonuclease VII small subunit; Short=Exonuclease VII small subunit [Aliivibrio salmonicida LFI1238]AZL84293.1 exodeoxyribonuclease VII small subunit [Aliivibrio salmonicida]MBB1312778.1 exodeoxyribonuclease VII small subunit [Aliivibrio sp. SR45-2]OCH20831.1 exodeoxyribonuclease VII small subunit [Aliivibrio logei]OEF09986.1 exodeoxyribonucleas
MAVKKPENLTFEAAIEELDSVVNQLESGDLPLEDALKKFERGISLARAGQEKLTQAEQRVDILLQADDNAELTPFDANDD